MATTTLVVEDDPAVRSALVHTLAELGHVVRSAATATDGLREAESAELDLVVLDLGLPDIDGVTALRMLRSASAVPVIVSTARAAEEWLISAFNAGADDYIVKPFSRAHLGARVTAVLRRTGERPSAPAADVLEIGDLVIDRTGRTVEMDGNRVSLTRREFDLLAHLAIKIDKVVSRRELFQAVWGQSDVGDNTVDVHISWLRRKLGETAAAPRYLHTVRGVGLKLVAPDRNSPARNMVAQRDLPAGQTCPLLGPPVEVAAVSSSSDL